MVRDLFHITFRQGERLGEGQLGTTWAAEGPEGERLVVRRLAGLAPAAAEAAEMAERMAGLGGCVAPVAIEAREGDLWLLYPFVEGVGAVEAAGTTGFSGVGADLERAVARLHAAGLVHGALRDSNVRVTAAGEVLLLDAGLAGLGALGAVGVATAHADRRDLAALLDRMAAARRDQGAERLGGAGRRRLDRRRGSRAGRRAAAAVPVIAVVVILVAFGMARAGGGRAVASPAHPPRDAVHPPPLPPASRCTTGSLPGLGAATYFAVDMTGSGCAEPMAWAGGVIATVSASGMPMRFSLGRAGDALLIGHWFCSRAELPALYRPDTGQVFYIPAWPLGGSVVTSDPAVETGIRGGRAQTSESGGCEQVQVAR